jgi:putative transcriptional regulator
VKHSSIAWAIFFALVVLSCTQAFGQTFVVATPELQGAYKGAVMLAVPFEDGHIGIILNRPSQQFLPEFFPEHAPSKNVKDPVYIGGPVSQTTLFAVVPGEQPHPTALELMPGLWLVSHADTIDRVIESRPNEARYFGGFVAWRPGELDDEVKKGYFVLRPADKAKALQPDTSGLWEDLHLKKGQVGT